MAEQEFLSIIVPAALSGGTASILITWMSHKRENTNSLLQRAEEASLELFEASGKLSDLIYDAQLIIDGKVTPEEVDEKYKDLEVNLGKHMHRFHMLIKFYFPPMENDAAELLDILRQIGVEVRKIINDFVFKKNIRRCDYMNLDNLADRAGEIEERIHNGLAEGARKVLLHSPLQNWIDITLDVGKKWIGRIKLF